MLVLTQLSTLLLLFLLPCRFSRIFLVFCLIIVFSPLPHRRSLNYFSFLFHLSFSLLSSLLGVVFILLFFFSCIPPSSCQPASPFFHFLFLTPSPFYLFFLSPSSSLFFFFSPNQPPSPYFLPCFYPLPSLPFTFPPPPLALSRCPSFFPSTFLLLARVVKGGRESRGRGVWLGG